MTSGGMDAGRSPGEAGPTGTGRRDRGDGGMGDIGTERREVEFEPLPDEPAPEPRREPAPAPEPERAPA